MNTIASLGAAFEDVRDFHKTFGHPAPDAPTVIPQDRVEARAGWLDEEAQEFRAAALPIDDRNDAVTILAKQADAMIDGAYFNLGGLVELGIDPSPLWDIVHRANMAKLWPDGTVHRRPEDGKVIKPPGWQDPGPLIRAEVERQIAAAAAPSVF
jgi:predicted HAD superfamily Cof-like phosphohydrolase